MANQRYDSVFGKDGRQLVNGRPGAAVTDFPATSASVQTSSVPIADDGGILLFSTVDFYLDLEGTATSADMRYPAGLHLIPVKSGDVVSVLGTASATFHIHLTSG